MKLHLLLTFILFLAYTSFGQAKADYSGEWTLNFAESNISDKSLPPAFSKSITQNQDKIEILNDAVIKKTFPDSHLQPIVYSLDGKPNMSSTESGVNQMLISSRADFSTGNLEIHKTATLPVNSGQHSTTIESWKLSDDAKTLKIIVSFKNFSLNYTSELVYTKSDLVPDKKNGIVNGRARQLIKPAVSPEARKAKVEGNIIVEVLINEKGDVVLAKTISGHPTMAVNSEQAARLCKFSPTKYKGAAVSVTGIIVYTIARA